MEGSRVGGTRLGVEMTTKKLLHETAAFGLKTINTIVERED